MVETIVGGLLGGAFRIVPEVLKVIDAKNERKHELAMQDKAIEFQRLKGSQKIDEIVAQGQQDWNVGALDALKSAIEAQKVEYKPTGHKFADMLMALTVCITASVRPVVTYLMVFLYITAKGIFTWQMIVTGAGVEQIINELWTDNDKGLLAAVLNFWFLGRVFDKVK